ncbi:uncharacterized protein LOC126982879 [Eriocheir sinensis]|uniref:uncharacterized protein LOC126982879 n=1 Tax=Eriocheir sinensis TaxID=95602 RepID=UPI0021C6B0F2|nr:uncharacterized protein LOC126982879 [Eriocheir sinensis]
MIQIVMKAPTSTRTQYHHLSHHQKKCCTTNNNNNSTNTSATGRTRHQSGGGGGNGGKGGSGGGGRGGRVVAMSARRLSTIRVTFSQSMVNLAILDPATAAILAEQTRHLALVSRKMRRRQNTDSTDIELEVPTDPYMEAIMFPTEPRPEWHRHLRQVLNKAGQKIFKKSESHDTTIPENLRHQLKHIYVY